MRSVLAVSALLLVPAISQAQASGAALAHFENKVRPLLAARCWKCHGPDKVRGGLRLDSAAALAKGGDSGPVMVPGKPDASPLIQAVRHAAERKMPPDAPLSQAEIDALVEWARSGAVWPSATDTTGPRAVPDPRAFWAFQGVRDPLPPVVRDAHWPTSPIDRFILAKLEAKGLRPSRPADRRTLLRRLTFDLIGLPPSPDEVEAFVSDPAPDAYEKQVERLLASPHYGERWGRHWLDVVRYADTTANDANCVLRYAWRYRDYVRDAFNADKPYDRFLIEQLAGDLLPASDARQRAEQVVATGFLLVGPKALAETDKEQTLLDIADEQLDVTGRAFLGLTVSCARCHDHKFDPIPTADYYSLAGIFRSTEALRDRVPNASMWQEWSLDLGPGHAALTVMAPREGTPADLPVFIRGDRRRPGTIAPRRFPRVLGGEAQPPVATGQSGRLELARWIASPTNPLTARVMANRIWQHHFGTGLVATSDNFGARGEPPSHPELLDWLAARLVASKWSIKAMHRLIVMSNTYRMAGVHQAQAQRIDPAVRLLWRMPRRRLEAEALRDAMLAVSGGLDRAPAGKAPSELLYSKGEVIDRKRDFFRPNQLKADDPYYLAFRQRSFYLPVVRNALPDALALFDAADPNGVTAVRNDTTVATQALYLLNSPFVREQARWFAESLPTSDTDRVRAAFLRALARPPAPEERVEALAFVRDYKSRAIALGRHSPDANKAAWQSWCQVLLCSNEFLYLE